MNSNVAFIIGFGALVLSVPVAFIWNWLDKKRGKRNDPDRGPS